MPLPYARAGVLDGKATATCPECSEVFTGTDSKAATRAYGEHYVSAHAECVCVFSCADDPATACSLSGQFHTHPNAYRGDVFGPCAVHPNAPGDV